MANVEKQRKKLRLNIARVITYTIRTFGFWVDFSDEKKVLKVLNAGNVMKGVRFVDPSEIFDLYIDVLHDFCPLWDNLKVFSDKSVAGAHCNVYYTLNKKYVIDWVMTHYDIKKCGFTSVDDLSRAICRLDPLQATRDFGD